MASGIHDHLSQALAELRVSHAAQGRAIMTLETAIQASLQQGLNALPVPAAPISEHRRAYRPGRVPKIASDPELQAFIAARVDRMTFEEIAAEVGGHFPENRRVGRSAIHDWWQKAHRTAATRFG